MGVLMKRLAFPLVAFLAGCEAPKPVTPIGAPVLAPILAMMVSGPSAPTVRVVLLDSTIAIPHGQWADLKEGGVGDTAAAIADMLARSQRRWPIAPGDSPVPLVSRLASDPATLVVSVSAVGLNTAATTAALYWTVSVESQLTQIYVTYFARDDHRAPWVISTTRRLLAP